VRLVDRLFRRSALSAICALGLAAAVRAADVVVPGNRDLPESMSGTADGTLYFGKTPLAADVLGFLESRIAKWWMPDDMRIVTEIPHTATGKINKLKLRESFKDYRLPTA
jgi:acyl-CoA synthetase (AMP-forming)/AMP-acid ligase II